MTPYNPFTRPRRSNWAVPNLASETVVSPLDTTAGGGPYPENPTPMPKPPVNVPPKPPYPENPIPMPKPIPPASPSPTDPWGTPVPKPTVPTQPTPVTPVIPVDPGPDPTAPEVPMPKPPARPVTGTNLPPSGFGVGNAQGGTLGLDFMRQVTPNELVQNQLQGLLSQNSAYMNNARLRGMETAARRGLGNSSIAAGASQRSALEAALPIASADAEVYRTANEGNFSALNQLRQMRTAAELDNWLSSETYNRDFNGRLAMLPITSAIDMLSYIQQRAVEDPSVYTPEVISGINNFFNLNMQDILGRFFPMGGGGNG